jgi:SLT domain-containing protein
MTGRVLGALTGLGHSLYAFAHAALTDFLDGLKAVGGSVLSWLRNFIGGIPNAIMKFLHMSPPHAGSAFYDLGANIMHHLEAGIKATAHRAVNAATVAARQVANVGSGVQRWAPLVRQALAMEGLSPTLLHNVLYQMMTESGGDPNIVNNTDINARNGQNSRGLMQVIPPTFAAYHWPGTSMNIFNPLANIAAALNYARHVYGPSLMSGGMGIGSGHGYAAGGMITEPIWGIGASGRSYSFGERGPEMVIPGSGGQPSTARVEALLAQILAAVRVAPAATSVGMTRALNGMVPR